MATKVSEKVSDLGFTLDCVDCKFPRACKKHKMRELSCGCKWLGAYTPGTTHICLKASLATDTQQSSSPPVESKTRYKMTRGEMLKTIRQLQKLTPQDLAHASGLSVEMIRSYESDELSYTTRDTLITEEARRLAKALDVSLDVLFYPDKFEEYHESLPTNDDVNHPSHYTSHPSGVECITITEHHNFNVGNAIKYLWRAGLKDDVPVKDLKKAVWYIQREIERLSKKG